MRAVGNLAMGLGRLGLLGDNWWAEDQSGPVVDDLGTAQGTTITASPPLSPQGATTTATPNAVPPRTDYSGAIMMLAGLLIIAIGESQ